jgi:methionyl-tRNA formyltransferase
MIKKDDGHIDFSQSATEIERHIRAMTPWPGAFGVARFKSDKKIVKIISVSPKPLKHQGAKGELIEKNNSLILQCGHDALAVQEIQIAGKKKISGLEFIHGHLKNNLILY